MHDFAVETITEFHFVWRIISELHLRAYADLDVCSVCWAKKGRDGVQCRREDAFWIEGDQGGDGSVLDPLNEVQRLLFGIRHLHGDRCDAFDGEQQLRVVRQAHPKAEALGESKNVDRVVRKAVVEESEGRFGLPVVERKRGIAVVGELLDVQLAIQMAVHGVKRRQLAPLRIQIRRQMLKR